VEVDVDVGVVQIVDRAFECEEFSLMLTTKPNIIQCSY
jgi:hypothetical protein